jgi:transcriptional regulator of acetoin/glycerol metabolism
MSWEAIDGFAAIRESWVRCRAAGLAATWVPPLRYLRPEQPEGAPSPELGEILARAEQLFRCLAHQPALLLIADAQACLRASLGAPSLRRSAARIGALPGAEWSETGRGTNAIAMALHGGGTAQVLGAQHYLDCLKDWSGAATPLGKGLGVLALYVQGSKLHPSAPLLLETCVAPDSKDSEAVAPPPGPLPLDGLALGDRRMAAAVSRAKRILGRDIPLLVQGETGTGKEVFARAFHRSGPRAQGPFVAVNCAAIPATLIEAELFGHVEGAFSGARREGAPGKLRLASGGTLFLDEIGDMPLALQAVLLRVLETRRVTALGDSAEHSVDVSLLCASHQPLRALVDQGCFRGDLYFRLSGLTVELPPLREREDFARIAQDILDEESPLKPLRLSTEAQARLAARPWPGNVRELRNCLRLAAALANGPGELPWSGFEEPTVVPLGGLGQGPQSLREAERQWALAAVARHQGNISAAARELRITRTTLYRKLRGH